MADADQTAALALVRQLEPALREGDRARQNHIVQRLIALHAPMGDQWQALAHLVLGNGELTLARQAIDLFVDAQGRAPMAFYAKATVLEQSGALGEAYDLMRGLPTNLPDPALNAFGRGTAALYLGRIDEARGHLERAVRLQPRLGRAWLSLAMSADLAREPELAELIIASERALADAPPIERAAYLFSLGKAHVARKEHPAAFAAFAKGGREMRHALIYDRADDRADAATAVEGYDAERIAEIAGRQSGPTGRSIFVTGLPRSGTTLVEQVLTSHSEVVDGGEIGRLPMLAKEIRGRSFPALQRYCDAHGVEGAATLWRHLLQQRFPAPGRIVDKSLDTPRLLGLAAALLPDAPLVWLKRDTLDCAWSCFSNFFFGSMAWSYDLEDIAFHFRREDELLRKWQEILGERLLVVPYEQLATQPEPWIRRILSHCGLSEEPQAFAPHENSRKVTTASVMQVRRPISRGSIGAAEPYRAFLEPFEQAYRG